MTTGKKVLLGAIAIIGLMAIYGYKKAQKLYAIFEKMTIEPNSVPKILDVNLKTIKFSIDIIMRNPTVEDFAVSGYIATLTKVKMFYNNIFIGVANVSIDEISVPQQGTLILHNIPITVPITNLLNEANNLIDFDINKLAFTGTIQVAGNEFEIGA